MQGIIIRWLITTVAILLVPFLVSGVTVSSVWSALAAGAVLGILNASVRTFLIILTLPISVLTLGLFILVINAVMFELAAAVVPGVHVESFWSALFGSILVSIVSWILNAVITGGPRETIVSVHREERTSGPDRGEETLDMRRGKDGRWE